MKFLSISKKTLSEAELKAVIRSSCFVKEKTTPEGIVDKVKARVVAGGFVAEGEEVASVNMVSTYLLIKRHNRLSLIFSLNYLKFY